MTGRIIPRGENTWQIRLDFGRDATGKRLQKTFTVRGGIRQAQRELNRLLAEHQDGAGADPRKLTVAGFFEQWLRDAAAIKVSPRTLQGYSDMVRLQIAPRLGAIPLAKLTPLQIQEYERQLLENGRADGKGGLSAQTVLHHHRLLHSALEQAVKWRLLDRNPVDGAEPPSVERGEPPTLEEEGVVQLLRLAASGPLFAPLIVALATGLRRGELLALRWQDIDFQRRRLEVRQSLEQTRAGLRFKPPKTRKSRRPVSLPPAALEVLTAHQAEQAQRRQALGAGYQDQGLVFPTVTGEPWEPNGFTKYYLRLRRKIGIEVTFQGLRHSHASQLLRDGVHLKVVSERLGHSSIMLTGDTYSHVTSAMDDEVSVHTERLLRRAMEDKNEG